MQDGQAMLWDLNEGKHLYTLDGGDIINNLIFSPNRYWLCAATGPSIKIWVSYWSCCVGTEQQSERFNSLQLLFLSNFIHFLACKLSPNI